MTITYDHVKAFAVSRHKGLSFPYLKENGELLSIAANSGLIIEPRALELYREFYDTSFEILSLYPQFFRFIFAMTLDLEALGMVGDKSAEISNYIISNNLISFETSDTRRLEILHLLARGGKVPAICGDSPEALKQRIHSFISHSDQFTKFNRPFFYELTHLIFFLTDYGKEKTQVTPEMIQSLLNVGLLAILDNDADLLSEICLCLKFLDQEPPELWIDYCESTLENMKIEYAGSNTTIEQTPDDYHMYFVANWLMKVDGRQAFSEQFLTGTPYFRKPKKAQSVLSCLSQTMHSVMMSRPKNKIEATYKITSTLSKKQVETARIAISSCSGGPHLLNKLTHGLVQTL